MALPDELLLLILTEAAKVRSLNRALRLQLVCRESPQVLQHEPPMKGV
jgi:hypothetical protein